MATTVTATNFQLEDFQEAARTYRAELLHLAVIGLEDILPYVTVRMGVRYAETVGQSSLKGVEIAPYKKNAMAEASLDIVLRELKTYFGAVNAEFEPNEMISTILGHTAAQALGDGLKSTPTAKEVLALMVKEVSRRLASCIWSAKRNPAGNSTSSLFDGWDTITDRDIEAGLISGTVGNYTDVTPIERDYKAMTLMKEIMYALPPELREKECFIFCDQSLVDRYNEEYLLTHPGIVYNQKYNQVSVEGSNGKLTFVPLASKAGSQYWHICPKSNMLVGVDQLSDLEKIEVGKFQPDTITMMMRMFFGVEFESVDPTVFHVVKHGIAVHKSILPFNGDWA